MPRIRQVDVLEEIEEDRQIRDEIRYGVSDPKKLAQARQREAEETAQIIRDVKEIRDQMMEE